MEKRYLLGLDAGGSGARAAIFDFKGNCLGSGKFPYGQYYDSDGGKLNNYFKVSEVQDAVCKAIKKVIEDTKIDPNEIAGITSAVNGCTWTGFDGNGNAVTDIYSYSDFRYYSALPEVYKMMEDAGISRDEYRRTMRSDDPQNLAFIYYIRKYEPEVAAKVKRWAFSFQPVVYSALGGNWNCDPVDFAPYIGIYDVWNHKFNEKYCDIFGIYPSDLCELQEPHTPCGSVSEAGAARTGLAAGIPLFSSSMDHLEQMLACGAMEKEDDFFLMEGSSGVYERLFRGGKLTDKDNSMIQVLGGDALDNVRICACTGVFGVTFQWVRDNIAFAFNQEESEAKLGMDPYDFLCDCAAKSPVGANGVVYRPSLFPWPISGISTKGSFHGLTVTSNINDMIRATLEGLAYEARNGAELVAAATGIPIGDIYNCGGPSKSKLWNQILADVFGKRIYTPGMDPDLTGCKGAAMFAGLGLGIYKDRTDAIKRAVSTPVPVDPIPENAALYQKEFGEFKAYLKRYD